MPPVLSLLSNSADCCCPTSKNSETQRQLPVMHPRQNRGCNEWVVQPDVQIPIYKQLLPHQRHQIRQRPTVLRPQLQVLQQQDGDQRRPDLRLQRIGTGTHKSLDPQQLLQRLEEQFDLPALLVDAGDGGGPKLQVIGQKRDFFLLFLMPDGHQTQMERIVLPVRRDANIPITKNIAVLRHFSFRDRLEFEILFETRHEVHSAFDHLLPPVVVDVGSVDDQNRSRLKVQRPPYGHIALFAVRNAGEAGQVAFVIQ